MLADTPLPPESDQRFDIGSTPDSLDRMRHIYSQLGDAYRVWAPGRDSHTWVFNHPDDVRRILITNWRNYTKGVGFDRIKMLLGNGIIVSEGEFWKRQRRMLQPTFHRRILARFDRVIAQANARLLERWESACDRGEPVNVTNDMSTMTLEVILRAIFGDDVDAMTAGGSNPFAVLTDESARDLRFAYEVRKLTTLLGKVIAARRAASSTSATPPTDDENPNYLSMLLSARDKDSGEMMTDREILDEVMTLIIAGHETTANALNWTWYLLGEHPQVEARLHAEIDAMPEELVASLQSMETLRYAYNVLREALRLYPPVWVISRRTIAPDTLAGYTVPADTDVFFSPWFVHRHPQFWSEPERFMPERFDDGDNRPKLAYVPFSAGPHHCIGETLSFFEMLVHLNRFARRFRLRRVDTRPVQLEAAINLRATEPFIMRLERRQAR
ncbi:MAG: cytochrome P450 [Nevskiaceae bacterium]|jgi:cytochrome P450|nr:cytochrome P450 [Nevskiaceae bacterium]